MKATVQFDCEWNGTADELADIVRKSLWYYGRRGAPAGVDLGRICVSIEHEGEPWPPECSRPACSRPACGGK